MSKVKSIRLPSHIKPERYRIMVRPDFSNFTFTGEETIYLNILKPVKEIILHAVDLKISDVKIGEIKANKISFNKQNETVTFSFSKSISKGKAELSLKFKGQLTDKLKGFYRSRYVHEGQEKFLATTQLEATDARRAFPCFDEPAQKAIFDITLQIPKAMAAVSNTIETSVVEHVGGYKTVQFAPSPKMSSYLVAFIVGDLEFVETKSKRGVTVRVFTTKGKKHQAKFALETAARALDFYEDYFDIPYPLLVLDMIAVPDFAAGAMENWGAITYRETALLFDEQNSSAANKQWVAIVIAHEISHQWFGNLVTMQWWTDLWLNEGFASYMEYLCVNELFPEWQMWNQYVAERFAVALRLDALKTSHPIEIEVHHPNEIGEIFDQVSYAKGSVMIRMLAEFLGAKVFRDGLRHYLKKHAYGNTITMDLWKSLEIVSKKPVSKIMTAWTKQTGYPLIEVTENFKSLILSQSRFFSSEISKKQNKQKTIWPIPLTVLQKGGQTHQLFINKSKLVLPKGKSEIVKFNSGETSLARVKYPLEKIRQLMPAITNRQISAPDRLGIIRDAFALAEAGQFSTVEALKLAKYYVNETELPVWEVIAGGLHAAGGFYVGESWYKHYEEYCKNLYLPLVKNLGWQKKRGEGHLDTLLRNLSLAEVGYFGHKPTILQAQKLFKSGKVEPNLRGLVYNLVAQNGGQKEFQKFVSMYKSSGQHHEEQERVGRAMGSFKNKKILNQVLKFAFSKHVRAQDAVFIFNSLAKNFYGRDLAWEFLKNNWDIINRKYNIGGHLLEYFVISLSGLNTVAAAKDFERFFKNHPAPQVNRAISQVLERIYSNAAWIKRERQNIILNFGGIGVLPTDTMYGIVGSALNKKTVAKIYRLRKRNSKKPLIVLVGDFSDLSKLGIRISQKQLKLLKQIWPGPISVILPCAKKSLEYLHRGTKTIAVRLPKNNFLMEILKQTGPLVAPSANWEGQSPAKTVKEAKKYFGDKIDFYYDGGKKSIIPSTIIKFNKTGAVVVRPGAGKIPKNIISL